MRQSNDLVVRRRRVERNLERERGAGLSHISIVWPRRKLLCECGSGSEGEGEGEGDGEGECDGRRT